MIGIGAPAARREKPISVLSARTCSLVRLATSDGKYSFTTKRNVDSMN
jgi:hypothetical protein